MKRGKKMNCAVSGCDKPKKKRNSTCSMHSARWNRHKSFQSWAERRISEGQVLLTKGESALIDPEDAQSLSSHCWHATEHGYAAARAFDNSLLYMHRVVMNAPDGVQVDHKNGNRLDNRKVNLRLCNQSQNLANQPKPKSKTGTAHSKYKGVTFAKGKGKWKTQLVCSGKRFQSYHQTEGAAALAYNRLALEKFGEFARLNDVAQG